MGGLLSYLASIPWWSWILVFLALVAIRDIFFQRAHTITHNYPIVGHLRYWLESIGPEMRQYFVANNREELPFNRIERSWIYASAKKENNYEVLCQFTMGDIQVNVDDDYLSSDLKNVYGYEKANVEFNSMQELFDCSYLGGKRVLEKTS